MKLKVWIYFGGVKETETQAWFYLKSPTKLNSQYRIEAKMGQIDQDEEGRRYLTPYLPRILSYGALLGYRDMQGHDADLECSGGGVGTARRTTLTPKIVQWVNGSFCER